MTALIRQDVPAAGATPAPDAGIASLPLVVVDRTAPPAVLPARGFRRAVRLVPFAVAAAALVAGGGLIGLYFQPPGLRKAMELLRLEPGGGTSSPIAVPAPRPPERDATPCALRSAASWPVSARSCRRARW